MKITWYLAWLTLVAACVSLHNPTLPRPATTADLIRNVKDAVEYDLFLNPEFYGQQNLLTNFGGEHVETQVLEDSNEKFTNYIITGFPNTLGIGGFRADIMVQKRESKGETSMSRSQIFFGPPDQLPTFDKLVSSLGPGWIEDTRAEGERYMAAAREPFNKSVSRPLIMTYMFPRASNRKSVTLEFDSNRRLWSLLYFDWGD